MDTGISNQLFVVCGATSGFGRAIAESLAREGAFVIAAGRREAKLQELSLLFPGQITTVCCDITTEGAVNEISAAIGTRQLHGILVNAGGPPAMAVMETKLDDWDLAYRSVLRWKIALTQHLVPAMIKSGYGRFLFIESAAVKQPIENLVLSNSMRLAVVGYVKSLSEEISRHGITLNVLAPGFHNTAAMDRILNKKEAQGIPREDAVHQNISQTSVGFIGEPHDFAMLATWLLSPHSRFITGQTISVDGGSIKGVMG